MPLVKQEFRLKDAIGRTVLCEDGIARRVVEIVGSPVYPWKAVINEGDPDSNMGFFVNLLSLSCQMLGKPLPTLAQQHAFERMIRAFGYQGTPKPRLSMHKGLIVPTDTVN